MPEFNDVMALLGRTQREAEHLDDTALTDEELARWVHAVKGVVERFKVLTGEAEHELVARVGGVEGATRDIAGQHYEVIKRGGHLRKWDNDGVRRVVLGAALVDRETGEVLDGREAVDRIGKLYPLGGAGLRLTAIREMVPEFDVDEYAERAPTHLAVKITEQEAQSS